MDPLLFPITGFYAALLGLMLVALSVRVVTALWNAGRFLGFF